jgi:hypothetical protein
MPDLQKPRLALTIGATGHRSNRLPQDARAFVERSLASALAAIFHEASEARRRHADRFAAQEPLLTIATALAEGADCMAAQASIAAGYRLKVILPFAAQDYAKDFSEAGLKVFSSLRGKADETIALNGDRARDAEAYEAAGLAILDASDILIAIWDRRPSAGRGGTVEIMDEAVRRGMPVILVDARGQAATEIVWRGLRDTAPDHADDTPSGPMADHLAKVLDALVRAR